MIALTMALYSLEIIRLACARSIFNEPIEKKRDGNNVLLINVHEKAREAHFKSEK